MVQYFIGFAIEYVGVRFLLIDYGDDFIELYERHDFIKISKTVINMNKTKSQKSLFFHAWVLQFYVKSIIYKTSWYMEELKWLIESLFATQLI